MLLVRYVNEFLNDLKFIFLLENEGKIKLGKKMISKVKPFVQDTKDKLEAGGVLLGRFLKDSKNIIIDDITVPMVGDIRKRNYFKRSAQKHQQIIDKVWKESDSTCNYLGEWHTHAENYPTPSSVDYREWKRKLKEDKFSSRYLYFIIIGIKSIRVWEGDRRTLKIKRINHNG